MTRDQGKGQPKRTGTEAEALEGEMNAQEIPDRMKAGTDHREEILMRYKLAVMYVLWLMKRPVTTSELCDILLESLFTHFFFLQESLDDLVDTGFL